MALKGDRYIVEDEVTFFCNDTTVEAGNVLVLSTVGSGAALGQAAAVVTVAAYSSGKVPIGMIDHAVVNLDLTRQHINEQKDEVQSGNKVKLVKKGWMVTNRVHGTPTAGQVAYLGSSGAVHATLTTALVTPTVGRFLSTLDEDGYLKVQIDLP